MDVTGPLHTHSEDTRESDPPPSRRYAYNPYETQVGRDSVAAFAKSRPRGRAAESAATPQGSFQRIQVPSGAGSQFLKGFGLDYVSHWCPIGRRWKREVVSKEYMQSVVEDVGGQSSPSWKDGSSESRSTAEPRSQAQRDWADSGGRSSSSAQPAREDLSANRAVIEQPDRKSVV